MAAQLEFTHDEIDNILIIRINGDMFYENSKDLNTFLEQTDVEKKKHFLINIKGVSWVDSMSLSVILAFHKRVAAASGKLIISDICSLVRKIMELTRIDNIVTIAETEEDALKALRSL